MKELAQQLRCPTGSEGIEIAENMCRTNQFMIQKTIEELDVKNNNHILEVGFGNGKHVSALIEKHVSIKYVGVDISSEMISLAQSTISDAIGKDKVSFQMVDDSGRLPFIDQNFSRIFSVNTIYFWPDIHYYLNEWYRVLKPYGRIVISFLEKDFAKTLPFTHYGFTLYSQEEVILLLKKAQFTGIKTSLHQENILKKDGSPIQRSYLCISATKGF